MKTSVRVGIVVCALALVGALGYLVSTGKLLTAKLASQAISTDMQVATGDVNPVEPFYCTRDNLTSYANRYQSSSVLIPSDPFLEPIKLANESIKKLTAISTTDSSAIVKVEKILGTKPAIEKLIKNYNESVKLYKPCIAGVRPASTCTDLKKSVVDNGKKVSTKLKSLSTKIAEEVNFMSQYSDCVKFFDQALTIKEIAVPGEVTTPSGFEEIDITGKAGERITLFGISMRTGGQPSPSIAQIILYTGYNSSDLKISDIVLSDKKDENQTETYHYPCTIQGTDENFGNKVICEQKNTDQPIVVDKEPHNFYLSAKLENIEKTGKFWMYSSDKVISQDGAELPIEYVDMTGKRISYTKTSGDASLPIIQNNDDWQWYADKIRMGQYATLGAYFIKASSTSDTTPTTFSVSVDIPEQYRANITTLDQVQYFISNNQDFSKYTYGPCGANTSDTGYTVICDIPEGTFSLPKNVDGTIYIYGMFQGTQLGTLTTGLQKFSYKEGNEFTNESKKLDRTFENVPFITITAGEKENTVKNGERRVFGDFTFSYGETDHPYTNAFTLGSFALQIPENIKSNVKKITMTDGTITASCVMSEYGDVRCDNLTFPALKPGEKANYAFSAVFSDLKSGTPYTISYAWMGWNSEAEPVPVTIANTMMNFAVQKTNKTTKCSDSDGGKIYGTRGTTTFVSADKKTSTKIDACSSKSPYELTEYYCKNGSVASEKHTCVRGCLNGGCVEGLFKMKK